MRGHVYARYNLGCWEDNAGNYDLALQHCMIAANMGCQVSLNCVKRMLMNCLATKADYAEALRGYQSATEEMQSSDRVEARKMLASYEARENSASSAAQSIPMK
ncbi:hypothetical protein THAOC_08047 [Thalassiosira oceanica]|uniref:Uncharacterized protein n=1 Tax=Thalassiosira oceanica TaxID=159749 RepID=K0TAV5_THAOC|nr:hypothetical protein THAOC_08047 [Thalassiosira oceanica]|eukprot:EJK70581.1 hypothetical protein THAOC_08047 [Thalassiosira oceanica]